MAQGPGSSATSAAFGATVEIAGGDQGLYYVVGRDTAFVPALAEMGARIVVVLDDLHVLAVAGISGFFGLIRDPRVRLAGPVTLDMDRFSRVLGLAGGDPPPVGAAESTHRDNRGG